jgi:RHS repeat-associated protein
LVTLTSEYVFVNGRRIARRDVSTGNVYYLFADMLGSTNLVASATGTRLNESQFYPYGGESVITQGLTSQKYKFEGKERDPESASTAQPQGLDNFGARFDSSATGRFMSPDWANKPEPVPYAKLGNPQTLNLYAFAGNNPESSPDIDGHEMMMSLDAGLDNGEMDDGSDNFANPSSSSQNSAASPNVQSGQQVQQQMGQDPTLPTEVQPPPPSLMDRVGTALLPKSPLDLALLVGTDGIGDIVEAGAALAKGTEESYSVYRITEEGETTYVGITKRTLAERGAEHGKDLEKIGGD